MSSQWVSIGPCCNKLSISMSDFEISSIFLSKTVKRKFFPFDPPPFQTIFKFDWNSYFFMNLVSSYFVFNLIDNKIDIDTRKSYLKSILEFFLFTMVFKLKYIFKFNSNVQNIYLALYWLPILRALNLKWIL